MTTTVLELVTLAQARNYEALITKCSKDSCFGVILTPVVQELAKQKEYFMVALVITSHLGRDSAIMLEQVEIDWQEVVKAIEELDGPPVGSTDCAGVIGATILGDLINSSCPVVTVRLFEKFAALEHFKSITVYGPCISDRQISICEFIIKNAYKPSEHAQWEKALTGVVLQLKPDIIAGWAELMGINGGELGKLRLEACKTTNKHRVGNAEEQERCVEAFVRDKVAVIPDEILITLTREQWLRPVIAYMSKKQLRLPAKTAESMIHWLVYNTVLGVYSAGTDQASGAWTSFKAMLTRQRNYPIGLDVSQFVATIGRGSFLDLTGVELSIRRSADRPDVHYVNMRSPGRVSIVSKSTEGQLSDLFVRIMGGWRPVVPDAWRQLYTAKIAATLAALRQMEKRARGSDLCVQPGRSMSIRDFFLLVRDFI